MIAFTGHSLDAAVVLTVDAEEIVQRLLQRAADRGPRRRHRGRHPAPPGGLHRADRAADRGLPRPRDPGRGRRHGRGRRGHQADLRGARRRPPELSGSADADGCCDRGRRDQDPRADRRDARAGLVVGRDPRAAARRPYAPGSPPASSTRIAEDHIRSSGAVPSFKGYSHPPFPASICASVNDEVVHGIPGDRRARRRRRHLDRLRRHRRRLARRRRDHRRRRRGPRRRRGADAGHRGGAVARHRRRPPRRPGHRHLPRRRDPRPLPAHRRAATGSSRTTPATASAPRCTSRPTCPTTAGRAGAPSWSAASRWRSSRWSRSAASDTELLADEWTVVTADGSWAAHFEHTFTLTPDGAWVLTALDGGEQRLQELGVPFGGR